MSQQAVGSSATVHYSSPRLRREAKEDTLDIIQQYQTLMNNLVLAKRQEALVLAKQLHDAQDQVAKAKTQAKEADAHIQAQQAQLDAQALLVKELEAKIQALSAQTRQEGDL